ncbi:MAG: hypothetical protein IPM53_16285 [Anaerolineaceae bacterium]|nr:hypothetical protein [Anaerolineaceae bacterium]
MIRPFHVIWRAFAVWWDQWFILTILNIGWFVAQLFVVMGPPATAVLFAMTQRTLDGDFWDHREVGQAFREMFWPAWRWGALNLLVVGVAAFNLLTYADAAGVWNLLRMVWLVVLVLWGSLNLFYWPFWLEQDDRSMWTTYANCGRFLLLNIWQTPLLLLVCALLTVLSVATTLPFTLALMVWLGLLAGTAVRHSLAWQR